MSFTELENEWLEEQENPDPHIPREGISLRIITHLMTELSELRDRVATLENLHISSDSGTVILLLTPSGTELLEP